jgi:large subunit ribosomal protein L18
MSHIATLKRIRNGRTNYRKRAALLLARSKFITITVSDKNVQAQVAYSLSTGDVTITSSHSRELTKYGWNGSLNSIPACYLTGLLLGKKAVHKEVGEAILYTGRKSFTSRIAACLKGIIDAGMKVPASEGSFPPEDRLSGIHIAEYARMLQEEDKEMYTSRFSKLIANNFNPTEYPIYVQKVKDQIVSSESVATTAEREKRME